MSHKSICISCRKAYNQGNDFTKSISLTCPQCGKEMSFVNQKFKPPKVTDQKAWEIIEALIAGGYNFQSNGKTNDSSFPRKMNEVKEFLEIIKENKK